MPEETRYFTLSGNPPNGGVPPGRIYASIEGLPPVPLPDHWGPPPAYNVPHNNGNAQRSQTFYPTVHSGTPPRIPVVPPAVPPAGNPSSFESEGQYVNGHMMHGPSWTPILPTESTTIHWLNDGSRPFEAPNGYYPFQFQFRVYKAPSSMTVKELIQKLKVPDEEPRWGVTEMEELGDNRFSAGMTITQQSEEAKQTLAEVGWTRRRSEGAPIWLCVKR